MKYTTFFFDLDNTIYPASSGLWEAIRERINAYMRDVLGIPGAQVSDLRRQYFEQYGTALRGLEVHFKVDRGSYLAFVHDVRLSDYLTPDPDLRAALEGLPARKFIFTNADAAHAARVLQAVGAAGCFDGVIDTNAIAPHCKPERDAFEIALRLAGEGDPRRCVMIDDLAGTTRAARELGMYAVLFGAESAGPDADSALRDWSGFSGLFGGRG